jgi:hypothetical protein
MLADTADRENGFQRDVVTVLTVAAFIAIMTLCREQRRRSALPQLKNCFGTALVGFFRQ